MPLRILPHSRGTLYLDSTRPLGGLFFLFPSPTPFFCVTRFRMGAIGFSLSMVMRLPYWMTPRPGGLDQERLEVMTFHFLNAGLLLGALAEPWRRFTGDGLPRGLSALGGLPLFAIILTFAYGMQAGVKTAYMITAL